MIRLPANWKILFTTVTAFLFGLLFTYSFVSSAEAHPSISVNGNLAIGKTLTTSSTMSSAYNARYVLDSNDASRWESLKRDNQWLRVDLGSAQPIGKVSILWMANTTKSYDVQVSDNGSNWQPVALGVTNGSTSQVIEHNLNNVTKRYIRIYMKSRHSKAPSGNSIRELGIYSHMVTPTVSVAPTILPTPTLTPTVQPIATSIPTPTHAPVSTPAASNEFVTVCGMQLCLNGKPFVIHSATGYGKYQSPDEEVVLAKQAGLNTLELVEYEVNWRDLTSTMAEDTWVRNDQFIATAKANNLKIILNFSSYGHALARAGQKPTTTDWDTFLRFVMNRVNTVTGVRYADEPAIAKIQLYGEIAAPNYNDPMRGTKEETTAFYKRTLSQLKTLAPNHVISTGGFSYINDPYSGIDWKTIMSDPNNAVCDVEINSFGDRNVSAPNVSNYCKEINKPWFLAAWSSCQGTPHFSDDSNHWPTDAEMASHAEDMFKIARNASPAAPGPAITAVGSSFWNLGNTPARVDNCDIGNQYPLTLGIVQLYTP